MSEIEDLVKELRGEIPYRSDAPRLMEAAASMIHRLSAGSVDMDRREDAAYANGVKAALAILYNANVRNDQNGKAFELCEKIVRDRQAEVRASRRLVGSALDSPDSSGVRALK